MRLSMLPQNLRRNKKGMELSINFIVILIMSIVMFAGGLALINKFFKTAEEQKASIDSDTEAQIEQLLADGSRVAIPINRKQTKIGKSEVFGVGIYNILEGETDNLNFEVRVDFTKFVDVDNKVDEEPDDYVGYIDTNWIFSDVETVTIAQNKRKIVAVPVVVKSKWDDTKKTQPGTYIFNVHVCPQAWVTDGDCDGEEGSTNQAKPEEYYDGHLHKIYVEVK